MENLGHDLLTNILFRLPLGIASQAKHVCESWKTILSNKHHNMVGFLFTCNEYEDSFNDSKIQLYFGEEYDHIHRNSKKYYYSHETLMEMENCRFAFKPHVFSRILVGSCNGLVCFQKQDHGNRYIHEPFAICNPLTGESIYLKPNLSRVGDYYPWIVSSGFGYCQSTGEYKVVKLYNFIEEPKVSYAQVYTIGSNKWRDMETFIFIALPYESGPGIFANGVLHWLGRKFKELAGGILVFDLEDEKFGQLSLPEAYQHGDSDTGNELKLLGGNLCWVNSTRTHIEIWAYKNTNKTGYVTEERDQKQDYYGGNSWNWVKDFSIYNDANYSRPFAITKSNQVLLLGAYYLNCYDPETRAISSHWNSRIMRQVIPHANSYVSLKDSGETWYRPGCL